MENELASSLPPAEQLLAFSVDTHLLRELGALLVGRDSTAVVELIKNAYDADATHVVLHGEKLAEHGWITITDDGHGMTFEDFETKFLRIAGRSKESGARVSPIFGRKYTGAKGIGRLSAHKLGEALRLESVPDTEVFGRGSTARGFSARINWNAIEESEASIEDTRQIAARPMNDNSQTVSRRGTSLMIQHLFSEWRGKQLDAFLNEVRSTRPDPAIVGVPSQHVFRGEHLLGAIAIADTSSEDPGFEVELSGEFSGSESQWPNLLAHVNWMIEIDARDADLIQYRITPSRATREANPTAETRHFSFPRKHVGPRFVGRIYARDSSARRGQRLPDLIARFAREAAGIRLFMEGFRVLPYGAPRNDWLGLDNDYSVRRALELPNDEIKSDANDERTFLLPNSSYFGGIYLHDADSHGLEMVVNREGFLPGSALTDLIDNIRRGIQLSVRYRASVAEFTKQERVKEEEKRRDEEQETLLESLEPLGRASDNTMSRDAQRLTRWLDAGERAAQSLRGQSPASLPVIEKQVKIISTALSEVRVANDLARDEQAQLRILASLGTQIGAFVHEVNGVLGQALVIREMLDRLIANVESSTVVRDLRVVRNSANEMISALERQAVYLSDSLGAETRRRRSRQPLADRVATATRLLTAASASRHVRIEDTTPASLRTPPMFAAEMNVVLTNLMSNAIKAAASSADDPGVVRISAASDRDALQILVSNTGVRVASDDSERWFRPFETTTTDVDVVLGQGLGLGLPLTRRIIEEYGGTVQFVEPPDGFATAVEINLPNR